MGINYSPKIVTNGLVLCLDAANSKSYPGSGTVWRDLSGNGNNGTLINGPTFNSDNGGSLVFDGVNDYIEISDTPFRLTNPNFSMEIIFYYGGGSVNYSLMGKRNNTSPFNQYNLAIYSGLPYVGGAGNVLTGFLRKDGGSSGTDRTVSFTLSNPGLYHAVLTNNTSEANLYLNGSLRSTSIVSLGINSTYNIVGQNFRIAEQYNNNYFSGNIYLAKFYNRALTTQEIQQNFNATRGRFGI